MNKRYIDFVPAKKAPVRPRAAMVTRATVTKTVVTEAPVRSAPVVRPATPRVVVRRAPQRATQNVVRKMPASKPQITEPTMHKMPVDKKLMDKKPMLGVVEDLNSHFVETNVPKRPLSENHAMSPKPDVTKATEAKQKKVKARVMKPKAKVTKAASVKPVEKSVENSTYKPPKTPFINQNKVVKRPLSGNIYKHQIKEAVKEEPKGPVTIIAKPEKDRHIGIIVTIIITIILGAAAGTVAFLLLPK